MSLHAFSLLHIFQNFHLPAPFSDSTPRSHFPSDTQPCTSFFPPPTWSHSYWLFPTHLAVPAHTFPYITMCSLPAFYPLLAFYSSWTSWSLKMGPIRCPETSVKDYHSTLRNIPEECRFHQHHSRSLKSRAENILSFFSVSKYFWYIFAMV
jgi:hypothetical protein